MHKAQIQSHLIKILAFSNCQAQSQLQLNWTELVLFSISQTHPADRPAGLPE